MLSKNSLRDTGEHPAWGREDIRPQLCPGLVLPLLSCGSTSGAEAQLLERLRKRMSMERSQFSVLQSPRLQAGLMGLGEGTERKGLKAPGMSGKFSSSPGAGSRRTPQRDPGSDHVRRCPHRDLPQLPGPCRHCWGPAGDTLGPVMVRASTWWRQQCTGARGEPARVTSGSPGHPLLVALSSVPSLIHHPPA